MKNSNESVIKALQLTEFASCREILGGSADQWSIDEIGDGNVNLIFKVSGPKGKILLKQAVPYLRCVGESWPLSVQRNYFEYTALNAHASVAAKYLPKTYTFNQDSAAMAMEFLDDHIIMRKGMMQAVQYPNFVDHITDYMAKVLFFTSDLFLSAAEKKSKMKIFADNVELCKITEDLIFTDPYRKAEQNHWTSPQLDGDVQELQSDLQLKLAITEMKAKFLTSTEALIHGDLHTGSIMINQTSTKVIDPEFAFYGPMGFDVGLLLGNLMMSYFSQAGLGSDNQDRTRYEKWILQTISDVWNLFSKKFEKLWQSELRGDYLSLNLQKEDSRILPELRQRYMKNLFTDSIRFAGAEMIRRTLGLAHVADLDQIPDPDVRATCERRVLRFAKKLLVDHTSFSNIEQVVSGMESERRT